MPQEDTAKVFMGADFEWHHRKFRDLVRMVFKYHPKLSTALAGLNAHYMRHLMCSNLSEKGVATSVIRVVIGHKDEKTTSHYITTHDATKKAGRAVLGLLTHESDLKAPKKKRKAKAE
jgi:hypothetical protein